MKLMDTVEMMGSKDYKERFRAEYFQLKIRTEGLATMLKKYRLGTLPFTPTCSYNMLFSQLMYMNNYLKQLEKRAEIENIDLNMEGK